MAVSGGADAVCEIGTRLYCGRAVCVALSGPARADPGRLEDKGEALLIKHCERCHALRATGDSTHKEAPPFRQVVTRYPLDNLAEALAEGIVSGHKDMPEFVFAPSDIGGILAYLEKLKAETHGGNGAPKAAKP